MKLKQEKVFFSASEMLMLLIASSCLIIILVSFSMYSQADDMFSSHENNMFVACVGVKEFYKYWSGDTDSVGSIIIKNLNTSVTLYNGTLTSNPLHLTGIPHDTLLEIKWTDWRGAQTETHKVLCQDNIDRLYNVIPLEPTKPTQANQNF